MSENNVAFGLVRYDEICAIALDRHLSTSSISTRLEDLVGNYRHHAPDTALPDWSLRMRRIELRVKGAPSYPQSRLTAVVAANPRQWPPWEGATCRAVAEIGSSTTCFSWRWLRSYRQTLPSCRAWRAAEIEGHSEAVKLG